MSDKARGLSAIVRKGDSRLRWEGAGDGRIKGSLTTTIKGLKARSSDRRCGIADAPLPDGCSVTVKADLNVEIHFDLAVET